MNNSGTGIQTHVVGWNNHRLTLIARVSLPEWMLKAKAREVLAFTACDDPPRDLPLRKAGLHSLFGKK